MLSDLDIRFLLSKVAVTASPAWLIDEALLQGLLVVTGAITTSRRGCCYEGYNLSGWSAFPRQGKDDERAFMVWVNTTFSHLRF